MLEVGVFVRVRQEKLHLIKLEGIHHFSPDRGAEKTGWRGGIIGGRP